MRRGGPGRCPLRGRSERCKRAPVGQSAAGEARARERTDGDRSVANLQAHGVVRRFVKVRMTLEERSLLQRGRARHPIDIVVAVALDMRNAEQRRKTEVLL